MNDVTPSRASTLLADAQTHQRGVGAFNVVLLEHAEAIVVGAEEANLPVILQISQNCVRYHGSLEPITVACLALARRATVPVIVHLDHADDVDLVERAIEAGVDSVMFDASAAPYEENLARTHRVVQSCHAAGVHVEAELGEVGGKDGVHAAGARTVPRDAVNFVEATGVDSLAVAVGSSHAMTRRTAELDVVLISDLAAAVPVPLVLHGSSGVSDQALVAAIRAGMTKINISTHLNGIFSTSVRQTLNASPHLIDPRRYIAPARDTVVQEVSRLLKLLSQSTAES